MKCGITRRLLVNTFAAAESNFNRRIQRILSGRRGRMTLWLSLVTGAALVLIGVLGLPRASSSPADTPAQTPNEAVDKPKSQKHSRYPVTAPPLANRREHRTSC